MITIHRLQKSVDQHLVVDIEQLQIDAGEIVALVGPAGSGKESVMALLTGQMGPTAGSIDLAGIDPLAHPQEFGRQVGVLFAQDTLYKRQTTRENLRFHCRLRRLPRSRAQEVLEQVGLRDQAGTKAEKLTSSMARQLAFGRAILHQPSILLLFDPFARCSDQAAQLISDIIREMAAAGAAVLILAHDSAYLDSLCGVIHRLRQGRIVESYHPEEQSRESLPFMIPAKGDDTVVLVNPADILYVVAQDNTASLQTSEALLPTRFTLAELEERLSRSGFFRAHRSYLVNLQHVKELIPYTRNSYSLKLRDAAETKIPLSKSAAKELRDILGY